METAAAAATATAKTAKLYFIITDTTSRGRERETVRERKGYVDEPINQSTRQPKKKRIKNIYVKKPQKNVPATNPLKYLVD